MWRFIFYLYLRGSYPKKYVGKNGDLKFKSLTVIAFITFALVVDIVLSDVFRYTDSVSKSIKILYYALNMLLCLALLCLQMSMIKRKDIEQEMAMMSTLYEEQQKHYKIRKETIDLINIKCHDFRHQIREIGTNRSVDKKTIQEMQDLISFYDSEIHTGNKTIDTILTEKSLICHKKKIDFTCIADGKLLSFWKTRIFMPCLATFLIMRLRQWMKSKIHQKMYQSCRGKGKGRNRDKTRQLLRWQNRQKRRRAY